jgi:hypothetical protein
MDSPLPSAFWSFVGLIIVNIAGGCLRMPMPINEMTEWRISDLSSLSVRQNSPFLALLQFSRAFDFSTFQILTVERSVKIR